MNGKTSKLLKRFAALTYPRDFEGLKKLGLTSYNDYRDRRVDYGRRHLKRIKTLWNELTQERRTAFRREAQGFIIWAAKTRTTNVRPEHAPQIT